MLRAIHAASVANGWSCVMLVGGGYCQPRRIGGPAELRGSYLPDCDEALSKLGGDDWVRGACSALEPVARGRAVNIQDSRRHRWAPWPAAKGCLSRGRNIWGLSSGSPYSLAA